MLYADPLLHRLVYLVYNKTMTVVFRENWVVSEVAGLTLGTNNEYVD